MKFVLMSIISLGAVFSYTAQASNVCPRGIEGRWSCKASGMPGDGAETSFKLDIKTLAGTTPGYSFSGDRVILDQNYHIVPNLSRGPNSGSTLDWYRQNRCEDGSLLSRYRARNPDGTFEKGSTTQTITMQNENTMTIDEALSRDTDICEREIKF